MNIKNKKIKNSGKNNSLKNEMSDVHSYLMIKMQKGALRDVYSKKGSNDKRIIKYSKNKKYIANTNSGKALFDNLHILKDRLENFPIIFIYSEDIEKNIFNIEISRSIPDGFIKYYHIDIDKFEKSKRYNDKIIQDVTRFFMHGGIMIIFDEIFLIKKNTDLIKYIEKLISIYKNPLFEIVLISYDGKLEIKKLQKNTEESLNYKNIYSITNKIAQKVR